jgi:hypothetical protein
VRRIAWDAPCIGLGLCIMLDTYFLERMS